ncbi:MAG: amidophosphoribosyltransferase [Clostridiales bacterium]
MCITYNNLWDKIKEECGVFGIYSRNNLEVARLTYYALYALQHRGQESAGIAVNNNGTISYHKDMGLVHDVFNKESIEKLIGKTAIGHVRYSTTGDSRIENSQPMVVQYKKGQMALAHNGNLVNAGEIRKGMEEDGVLFQSTIDSEVFANLISRYRKSNENIEDCIAKIMDIIKGSYTLIILTPKKLVGVRDKNGIRPLCIGKIKDSYVLSSESCALDAIGAEFVRDVNPGEIVVLSEYGIKSVQTNTPQKASVCLFEYIYFARPDSIIDGASVHQSRLEAGRILAREQPMDADLVIGVPDSGLTAAIGYSKESGIPYGQGLIKNRYVGRTFIQPEQNQREMFVKIKLNAMKNIISNKRIVMIDDSIVRGTTSNWIVKLLKDSGAKEVHMKVSSPPVRYPCFFGMDFPSRNQLAAACNTVEEIKKMVGADSLGYISLEGIKKTPVGSKCEFCSACFDGKYPIEVPESGDKFSCG